MDTLTQDRDLLRTVFCEWQKWPRIAPFQVVPLFDEAQDRYVLLAVGWDEYRRIHRLLAHVEIRQGKFWIEEDNTDEGGIATDLLNAGVPKDRIVSRSSIRRGARWASLRWNRLRTRLGIGRFVFCIKFRRSLR